MKNKIPAGTEFDFETDTDGEVFTLTMPIKIAKWLTVGLYLLDKDNRFDELHDSYKAALVMTGLCLSDALGRYEGKEQAEAAKGTGTGTKPS